ncbi:MAG: hypothetical protein ACRDOI_04645 [Trebonia sp.]
MRRLAVIATLSKGYDLVGRPPGDVRKAADLYAQLLAAEPHATAER